MVALRYDLDWEQPKAHVDQLATRVLAVAAATRRCGTVAGIVDRFPLQGGTQSSGVQLFGEAEVPATRPDVSVRSATPEYFAAMGIPFLSGRPYVDGHDAGDRHEVVVNAAFARRYLRLARCDRASDCDSLGGHEPAVVRSRRRHRRRPAVVSG